MLANRLLPLLPRHPLILVIAPVLTSIHPDRVLRVKAENRIAVVEWEDRTLRVLSETRIAGLSE